MNKAKELLGLMATMGAMGWPELERKPERGFMKDLTVRKRRYRAKKKTSGNGKMHRR